MADDPGDDLTALRRRAFSRTGTPADLRRLADLEAAPPVATSADAPVVEEEVETPAEAPAAAPRAIRRPVLIAAAAGLLAGATIATLGILLAGGAGPAGIANPPPATALAIFDREPTVRDDPAQLDMTLAHILPGGLEEAELRWLGSVAEQEVYVARGTHAGTTTVCLIAARSDGTSAACTEQSEFEFSGLNLGNGSLELRWGPLGTEIWVAERVD